MIAKPPGNPIDEAYVVALTSVFDDRLLRIKQVIEIVSLSQAMIYRLVKDGRFPRPCKPGGVSSRWSEREVREWCAAVLAARHV